MSQERHSNRKRSGKILRPGYKYRAGEVDRNMPNDEEFIKVWNSSKSRKEVARTLHIGLQSILVMYRRLREHLKTMPNGNPL